MPSATGSPAKSSKSATDADSSPVPPALDGIRCNKSSKVNFLSVVLVCTVVFGGYHFVVQPYTGVTLFELTDILGGLYKADNKSSKVNFLSRYSAFCKLIKSLQKRS